MSIASGSVSLGLFKFEPHDAADIIEGMSKTAIPPMNALSDGSAGWATWRHMLDREINSATVMRGQWISASLTKAEKKIPASLLKTEKKIAELAEMKATGEPFVGRKRRQEIEDEVKKRLIGEMPVSLSSIDVAALPGTGSAFATATSDSNCDALKTAWSGAVGFDIVPVDAFILARLDGGASLSELTPTAFFGDPSSGDVSDVGDDFLTWIWFFSSSGGEFSSGKPEKRFAVAIDGPMTFFHEGKGAYETVLRKGTPSASRDAAGAMMTGKKLRKAKILLACGDFSWSFVFDPNRWILSGIKMPKIAIKNPDERFQERMRMLSEISSSLSELFLRKFLPIRRDAKLWAEESAKIVKWAEKELSR